MPYCLKWHALLPQGACLTASRGMPSCLRAPTFERGSPPHQMGYLLPIRPQPLCTRRSCSGRVALLYVRPCCKCIESPCPLRGVACLLFCHLYRMHHDFRSARCLVSARDRCYFSVLRLSCLPQGDSVAPYNNVLPRRRPGGPYDRTVRFSPFRQCRLVVLHGPVSCSQRVHFPSPPFTRQHNHSSSGFSCLGATTARRRKPAWP